MQKNIIGFKKVKVKIIKKRREKSRRRKKKMEEENKTKQNKTKNPENSTELQKLNIDTEAYNNNKKCD